MKKIFIIEAPHAGANGKELYYAFSLVLSVIALIQLITKFCGRDVNPANAHQSIDHNAEQVQVAQLCSCDDEHHIKRLPRARAKMRSTRATRNSVAYKVHVQPRSEVRAEEKVAQSKAVVAKCAFVLGMTVMAAIGVNLIVKKVK